MIIQAREKEMMRIILHLNDERNSGSPPKECNEACFRDCVDLGYIVHIVPRMINNRGEDISQPTGKYYVTEAGIKFVERQTEGC